MVEDTSHLKNAVYKVSFSVLGIFAVPAILALLVGTYVGRYINQEKSTLIFALALSFIFSWITVLKLYVYGASDRIKEVLHK